MSLPPPSWSMVSENNSAGKGLISSLRAIPLGRDSLALASLTSSLLNRFASSAEHPTPPGTPLYALLRLYRRWSGLCPIRLLLDCLRGFWGLPEGAQVSAEVVALLFGLLTSPLLLGHP